MEGGIKQRHHSWSLGSYQCEEPLKRFCPPLRRKNKNHAKCFALIHDLGSHLPLPVREIKLDVELCIDRNHPPTGLAPVI